MVGWMIVTAGSVTAAIVMAWKMRCLKKDIYDFAGQLEKCLDKIMTEHAFREQFGKKERQISERKISERQISEGQIPGNQMEGDQIPGNQKSENDIGIFDELSFYQDTLWSKTSEKLQRVNHIWNRKEEETLREKRMMKELISDISHQTRTPIANLKLYMEFLQEEELSEHGKEFLTKMERQTEKLDFLLQSMVKMSRLETGIIRIQSQGTDRRETLGQAVGAIVPKAEKKGIQLFAECEGEILISHDKKWTEEAIFNILDNGVKYTDEGGAIRIRVNVQEMFTKISIRDTGKGIAPERQAEIFARFYREPEVHDQEGIGIGLYLARKIIELQNGYIEVRSEAGQGADFQIYLPNDRDGIVPGSNQKVQLNQKGQECR